MTTEPLTANCHATPQLFQEVRDLVLAALFAQIVRPFEGKRTPLRARVAALDHPVKSRQPAPQVDRLKLRLDGHESDRPLVSDFSASAQQCVV